MKYTKQINLKYVAVVAMSLTMVACVGTKQLSHNISRDGQVQAENVIFPDLSKAWQKQGQFPNSENLAKIRAGVSKDELYQLIGRPHFSEAQYAREWDYIMKFYRPDESVQICQYKVIFDDKYRGQSFFWYPATCHQFVQPLATSNPVPPVVAVSQAPAIQEKITLSADALFRFDRFQRQDMLEKGQMELVQLAKKLQGYAQQGRLQVMITGHTDHFGHDMYNMNLSLLRAQTVRSVLIEQGVQADVIWATGAGETQPIQQCSTTLPKSQAIDCLQPNRRVEVQVAVYRD